jgi:surfeit locus 1 family protein
MSGRQRLWPVLLAAAVALAILMALGVWQVKRLAWKEGLIAKLEANAAAPPVDLAEAMRLKDGGSNIEFLKVSFRAAYVPGPPLKMIATADGGPGWIIISPAVTADGSAVLIDRGAVPDQHLAEVRTPEGEAGLTGIVRLHDAARGYFDPVNDPARRTWYWWDVAAMYQSAGFAADAKPLPFVVQLLPGPGASAYPRPAEPSANLRNNHLGYAITWFGLAAVLVVMTGFYIRAQMKKSSA